MQLIGRRPKSAQGMALRANIVLSCARDKSNEAVAQELRVCVHTVGKWRRRFAAERMAGLVDAPRSGAPREISDQKVEEVVTKTLETTPPARTHWKSWLMAKEAGISRTFGTTHLAGFWFKAAFGQEFQTQYRSDVRRKGT